MNYYIASTAQSLNLQIAKCNICAKNIITFVIIKL